MSRISVLRQLRFIQKSACFCGTRLESNPLVDRAVCSIVTAIVYNNTIIYVHLLPPLSIGRYSSIQLNELRQVEWTKLPKLINGARWFEPRPSRLAVRCFNHWATAAYNIPCIPIQLPVVSIWVNDTCSYWPIHSAHRWRFLKHRAQEAISKWRTLENESQKAPTSNNVRLTDVVSSHHFVTHQAPTLKINWAWLPLPANHASPSKSEYFSRDSKWAIKCSHRNRPSSFQATEPHGVLGYQQLGPALVRVVW